MKMPISEVIDRYTITLLKKNRTSENVIEEVTAYKEEIDLYPDVDSFINRLYFINGKIWDTEKDIRNGSEGNYTLEEIGILALKVRDLNRDRNGIKAELVEKYHEGFKELKVNYRKVDYGS